VSTVLYSYKYSYSTARYREEQVGQNKTKRWQMGRKEGRKRYQYCTQVVLNLQHWVTILVPARYRRCNFRIALSLLIYTILIVLHPLQSGVGPQGGGFGLPYHLVQSHSRYRQHPPVGLFRAHFHKQVAVPYSTVQCSTSAVL